MNCWTWMWSCVAQHHNTLNRVMSSPPRPSPHPSLEQSTVRFCRHSSPECCNMAWDWGQELKCIHGKTSSSCPALCPGLVSIRITQSVHFSVNQSEMKEERHPWQLRTLEPRLTWGQSLNREIKRASAPSQTWLSAKSFKSECVSKDLLSIHFWFWAVPIGLHL